MSITADHNAGKKTGLNSQTKKTIIVCGDLVWDTHIARLQSDPRGYFQPHLQSQLINRYGGAWYLGDVIAQAISGVRADANKVVATRQKELKEAEENRVSKVTQEATVKRVTEAQAWAAQFDAKVVAPEKVGHVEIEEGKGDSCGVAKGFSVWEWFDGDAKRAKAKSRFNENGEITGVEYKWPDGETAPGAWRIKEFLGCQQAKWPKGNQDVRKCPVIEGDASSPHLLVIDDLGLGFADHPDCWPVCLSNPGKAPAQILVKTTPPFDTPLWVHLRDKKWIEKVTVVVSAAALRDFGARLSRGFSWDQTLQEVKHEFQPGGVGWPLRNCWRVVVVFGRSGAAVFSRAPRSPKDENPQPAMLQFERMVFDPEHLEETWSAELPGITFGTVSALTAAFAAHALSAILPSSHVVVSQGLMAARELHRIGAGHNEKGFDLHAADKTTFLRTGKTRPEEFFKSAFPRELLDDPVLIPKQELAALPQQTLLTDALGLTPAFLIVAAQDIVRFGKERALRCVPRLACGKYFTVDRDEIERLNTVRNLILDYKDNRGDERPLSLAVFGPPGSGKSFAIKQLSEGLFGKDRAMLEFNLSQFEDIDALHEAFHEVRDKSVKGQMPLVFWDEFDSVRDTTPLGWLKEFLAPMQDAQFVAKGKAHPFGKCIFIFAGGTSSTFTGFESPPNAEGQRAEPTDELKRLKHPDFVSRLRGYVNIKGPNPTVAKGDEVYLIRRALMLRSLIERMHKEIIHSANKELVIAPAVLDAFLRVGDGEPGKGYQHGARSMEAIVSLSRLHRCRSFGPSELPAREVVELHVTPDFVAKVEDNTCCHFSPMDIEQLAAAKHKAWRDEKARPKPAKNGKRFQKGYVFGPLRDDKGDPPTHPLMVDYDKLNEEGKENNRLPARLTLMRLEALDYRITDRNQTHFTPDDSCSLPLEKLGRSEHRRWMRQKLMDGWCYGKITRDDLLIHADLCKFDLLNDREKHLDHELVSIVASFLKSKGWLLSQASQAKGKSPG